MNNLCPRLKKVKTLFWGSQDAVVVLTNDGMTFSVFIDLKALENSHFLIKNIYFIFLKKISLPHPQLPLIYTQTVFFWYTRLFIGIKNFQMQMTNK